MNERRALKGVIWSAIERSSVQVIQFIITVILARILTPNDFGIVAIILVLINILQVFNEVGFGAALMQKLDRDEIDYSTIFIFNVVLGLFLYLIIYAFAPYFASFFKQSSIAFYTRILGLILIINSFVLVQRTKLFILVDFKTLAKASFIAVIISGIISIYLANRGLGIMSIIIQQLINSCVNTILIWLYSKWSPRLIFSFTRFKVLFLFAYKLILARLFNAVFQEIYSIAIGKIYSPSQLGYFNRAKSFVSLSSNNLTTVVQRVSVPILCEVQEDKLKMGRILIEFIQKTSFIVYPVLCGLFVLAEPLIRVLLTEKWVQAVWMLQILCPVGMLYVISTFNLNVFNATGNTGLALKSEVIKKAINIIILISSIMISFEALIISQIFIAIIDFFIDSWFTKKQIQITWVMQIKSLLKIIIVSILMAILIKLIIYNISNDLVKLIIGTISGILFYLISAYQLNICNFKIFTNSLITCYRK